MLFNSYVAQMTIKTNLGDERKLPHIEYIGKMSNHLPFSLPACMLAGPVQPCAGTKGQNKNSFLFGNKSSKSSRRSFLSVRLHGGADSRGRGSWRGLEATHPRIPSGIPPHLHPVLSVSAASTHRGRGGGWGRGSSGMKMMI